MDRRDALRNMAVSAGALAGLPAWAHCWKGSDLDGNAMLSPDQNQLLGLVVEAIIPESDIPGAGELKVDKFVQTMITDCYDKTTQDNFSEGLGKIGYLSSSKYGKPFESISQKQKLEILEQLQEGSTAEKSFMTLLKNHTIQGFMTSEYVMTNITHYEFIPGRYHGCVPLVK